MIPAMKQLWVFGVFALLGLAGAAGSSPILPDAKLTPGDALTSDAKVICVPGYAKTVRNVPSSLKDQVYKSYGITSRAKGEYEIDHLISLELGGSDSIRNLWPQSFITQPLNAHVKDKLENAMHDLACGGKLTFQQAQAAIAGNWLVAYEKYLGPLPGGVKSSQFKVGAGLPASAPVTVGTPAVSGVAGTIPGSPSATGLVSKPGVVVCPPDKPIKGKISKSGKIYHLPGSADFELTKPNVCFATEAEAQAAGFRAPKR